MKTIPVIIVSFLLVACSNPKDVDSQPERSLTRLAITGVDFGYSLTPSSVPAGKVRLELTNEGVQPHQALLYRLNDGVDIEMFKRSVARDESSLPRLAESVGGMTEYAATDETIVTDTRPLEPGSYAVVCFVKDQSLRTNKNHAELGMIAPLEIR